MKRKAKSMVFVFLLAILATAIAAQAETLAWNAVTTYTDGSSIGTATVTYRAFWSTSSSLTSLTEIGSAGTALSKTFVVDTAGMTRGTTVYFTARSIVGGVESSNAPAMS